MKKITFICDKCGKTMPIDKKMSNENWEVFKVKCPCGGKSKIKIYEEDKNRKKR